ncbi:hypothetical protein THRCLA_04528 [Thraustotheca clavata]|uniref:AP-5 complex subunit beta-1 n=1 Tax=Thraustotheca clavata TaxID=74557 RepID=A0A1V9ZYR8_9STRA|nr:hypothetical protein THRCLA_04528 [Thraustotheca clavata]
MESKTSEGDASRLLQRATKMVALATAHKHALTRTDVSSLLQEALSPEASNPLKSLGFRLCSLAPSCISIEIWQLILDAVIKELAGANTQGSAATLRYAIPVFDVLPTTLILGFFMQSESEPLKKIQACVAHEVIKIRQVALKTFSMVAIRCTKVLFARGLTRFPFESNEARIVAQQDVNSILNDIWKMNVQAAEAEVPPVAAGAYSNLAILFQRSLSIQRVTSLDVDLMPLKEERGIDELVSLVYQSAAPRFKFLQSNAEKLPLEMQLHAMKWLSMLAYIMMQKSGGSCPGIANALIEVDEQNSGTTSSSMNFINNCLEHTSDDEDKLLCKVRVDILIADTVESWYLPCYEQVTLTQAFSIAQSILIIMAHPLQAFSRSKWSSAIFSRLTAMTQTALSATLLIPQELVIRLQICLLNSTNTYHSMQALQPTIMAISSIADSSLRQRLLFQVWQALIPRICKNNQYTLLEALCQSTLFHGCPYLVATGAKTKAAVPAQHSSYELFRALIECLVITPKTFRAQWVVLKQFASILSNKTLTESRHSALLLYVCLLSHTCSQNNDQATMETFLHMFVEPLAFKTISFPNIRVQLCWLCFKHLSSSRGSQSSTFLSWVTYELEQMLSMKDTDNAISSSLPYNNDGHLGHNKEPKGGSSSHLQPSTVLHNLQRFFALVLALKAILIGEPAFSQEILQILGRTRERHSGHRIICRKIDQTIEEIAGLSGSHGRQLQFSPRQISLMPTCILPDLLTPQALFPQRLGRYGSDAPTNCSRGPEVIISGSCDPLCLKVSFSESTEDPELVAVVVNCVNTSNIALSDFIISIGTIGPVKQADASNQLLVRLAGSELKPYASFTSEKIFQFQRFARVSFFFRVHFEGESPLRMGPCEFYNMPLVALLQLPSMRFATAPFFQKKWQTAAASKVYNVSCKNECIIHDILDTHEKVARIDVLDLVTPKLVQWHLMTSTKWKKCVTIVLSVAKSENHWRGTWEIRGPTHVISEINKNPTEMLQLISTMLVVTTEIVQAKRQMASSPRQVKSKEPLSPLNSSKDQVREGTPTTRRAIMNFFGGKS